MQKQLLDKYEFISLICTLHYLLLSEQKFIVRTFKSIFEAKLKKKKCQFCKKSSLLLLGEIKYDLLINVYKTEISQTSKRQISY